MMGWNGGWGWFGGFAMMAGMVIFWGLIIWDIVALVRYFEASIIVPGGSSLAVPFTGPT